MSSRVAYFQRKAGHPRVTVYGFTDRIGHGHAGNSRVNGFDLTAVVVYKAVFVLVAVPVSCRVGVVSYHVARVIEAK